MSAEATVQHAATEGRSRYIFLVFLGLLFAQPLLDPGAGILDLVLAVTLALGFIIYYVFFYGSTKPWQLGVLVLVGFLASFLNTGASVFFVYAGFMVGLFYTGRRLWQVLAGIALLVAVQALALYLLHQVIYISMSHMVSIVMLAFAGAVSTAEHARDAVTDRLRQANTTIATVTQVAERERIARDMHDVLGHTLSVVVLKSELAGRLMDSDPQRSAAEIRDVEQLARRALKDVRAAISGYRDQGLTGELANARLALEAADIALSESVAELALPRPTERALAMVLRESITNVLRHSGAHNVEVLLWQEGDRVQLEVRDDGSGGPLIQGEGLRGMRERLEALGGQLTLSAGHGTTVTAAVPFSGTA